MYSKYIKYKDRHSIDAEDLSENQRQFLLRLSKQLAYLELQVKKEAIEIIKNLKKRVSDENDWIKDYEIELIFRFCLGKDDPDYNEDEDNFLVELTQRITNIDMRGVIGDGANWNDRMNKIYGHHPMKDEHHCWMYHCLYDHTDLGWANILRIGEIWLDINVIYQHWVDVK